jgi:hypothetical protein
MDIEQVLSQFGGFKTEPARSIVHKVAASEGYDSPMVEALGVAFRFIRYNNTHGWAITTNWRSAFRGFMKSGDRYGGMADVPMAWFAAIADERKTF